MSEPIDQKLLRKSVWVNGCLEWQGTLSANGYSYVYMGKPHTMRHGHRLSYETWNGSIPDGMVVRHRCDNKRCINPFHLEVGTPADNSQDMVERGRSMYGMHNGNRKLTEREAREIKQSKDSSGQLAKKFGVCRGSVCNIRSGKTWKHLD